MCHLSLYVSTSVRNNTSLYQNDRMFLQFLPFCCTICNGYPPSWFKFSIYVLPLPSVLFVNWKHSSWRRWFLLSFSSSSVSLFDGLVIMTFPSAWLYCCKCCYYFIAVLSCKLWNTPELLGIDTCYTIQLGILLSLSQHMPKYVTGL